MLIFSGVNALHISALVKEICRLAKRDERRVSLTTQAKSNDAKQQGSMTKGLWRNGRRCGLKIRCPYGRASSSLARPTI